MSSTMNSGDDAQFTTDDALDAVESAKGVRSSVLSNNTSAKRAADGRVFVSFATSHTYGRSNGVEALRELDDSFGLTYNPHGGTQYAAQVADGMSREDAEAFVEVGAEYVSVRGYHVRITGFSSGRRSVEAEYPSSEFGDSRTEPKDEELVEQLVEGTATPMNADEVLDHEDETESMNVVGCPECEVYAVHEVVATPAAEVERANSLPDAVLECVACGAEFEAFDALEYNGE